MNISLFVNKSFHFGAISTKFIRRSKLRLNHHLTTLVNISPLLPHPHSSHTAGERFSLIIIRSNYHLTFCIDESPILTSPIIRIVIGIVIVTRGHCSQSFGEILIISKHFTKSIVSLFVYKEMAFIIHHNLSKTLMEWRRPVKLCIYDNIEILISITIKTIFLKYPQSFSIFLHHGIFANFISYHNRIP